jgi:hypothetical protein
MRMDLGDMRASGMERVTEKTCPVEAQRYRNEEKKERAE